MIEKTTYLLPIWIDLTHERHEEIMQTLNTALQEFFEDQCAEIARLGCGIDIQWSINKHVQLGVNRNADGHEKVSDKLEEDCM